MKTKALLQRISDLQEIQKTHRMDSPAWQTASDLLAPLFAEMAKRQYAEKHDLRTT